MPRKIAVIGGGAKAAALAAKAFCLRQFGVPVDIAIFEKNQIGSAWTGDSGYTDGDQRLCTPAERDLGFPYSGGIDSDVDEMMLGQFSWHAFKVHETATGPGLGDWVNRGRKPASHREFARYLQWAIAKAEVDLFEGSEVVSVRSYAGKWTVTYRDGTGEFEVEQFDGVVVTGPGPARRVTTIHDQWVLDGVSFWSRLADVRGRIGGAPTSIAILGGGGTAAAIAAWLVRHGEDKNEIVFINSQAMLFTRTASFFESRLFNDPQTWNSLSVDERRAFTTRLSRGVVWEAVTDILADSRKLILVPGRATSIVRGVPSVAGGSQLVVSYANDLGGAVVNADLVVDATGFDNWWFKPLFDGRIWGKKSSEELEESMREDLSFDLPRQPLLHAPMHSQVVGPGFVSLMVLGDMADRVLKPHVRAAATGSAS